MTRLEELIFALFNYKGETPDQIAEELDMPTDEINNVIECEANYRR